jgi:hypothetical protein
MLEGVSLDRDCRHRVSSGQAVHGGVRGGLARVAQGAPLGPLPNDRHLTRLPLEEQQWTLDAQTWLGVRWATREEKAAARAPHSRPVEDRCPPR